MIAEYIVLSNISTLFLIKYASRYTKVNEKTYIYGAIFGFLLLPIVLWKYLKYK
jgi:hypothetical protein